MIQITKKSACCGCYACYNACPKQCITMIPDSEGFHYPQVDSTQCIQCGLCEKVCPMHHPVPDANDIRKTEALAAYNRNDTIRLNSSSGGVFTLLAENILAQGGVVFGAAWDEGCQSVSHIAVETASELEKLRGSKYLQSVIGNTYQQAKDFLDAGRIVLFTGTPCQVGGLYAYLQKDYRNLFTQDLVCHGVASPLVWEKYLLSKETNEKSAIQSVSFRDKTESWKNFRISFRFKSQAERKILFNEDRFFRGFLSDLYLRPSCYECAFKGVHRQSDVTLADFWGIDDILPAMDDDRGTSLVLIHSAQGKALFRAVESAMICRNVDLPLAISYNPSTINSVSPSENREKFFRLMENQGLDEAMKQYCKIGLLKKWKQRIWNRLIRKRHSARKK